MKTLSKLVLLVILVLTLTILSHHQPGICATAIEYGLIGCGEIATPTGFKTAKIVVRVKETKTTGNLTLFIGKLAIQWEGYQNIVDCTGWTNETLDDIHITTANDDHVLLFFDGTSWHFQMPGHGISGIFTSSCP
jgi:hypothetical protein